MTITITHGTDVETGGSAYAASLGVAAPALVAGDVHVIVASVLIGGTPANTDPIDDPSGYTQLVLTDVNGTSNAYLYVFYRKATGSVSAGTVTLAFNASQTGKISAVPFLVQGADTTSPFLDGYSVDNDNLVAPAENATVADSMLITAYTQRHTAAFTWTDPAGMTQIGNKTTTNSNNTTQVGVLVEKLQLSATGSTGTKTASVSAGTGLVAAVSILINPAADEPPPGEVEEILCTSPTTGATTGDSWPANTPLTVTRPNITADQQHCIAITVHATTPTLVSAPPGYTLKGSVEPDGTSNVRVYLYARIGPVSASTFDLVISGSQTGRMSYVAWVLSGCNQADTFLAPTTASGLTAPSVTGAADQLLLTVYGARESTATTPGFTWTKPSSMTTVGAIASTVDNGTTSCGTLVCSKLLTSAGATGGQAATISESTWAASLSILVKPASTGGGTPPVTGTGLIAYMQALGGLTHYYGFREDNPLEDRIGSNDFTNKGGVTFDSAGAHFTGATNSWLETPDDPSFSIAGQASKGLTVIAFVQVTDWNEGTRDPNDSDYCHFLGKAGSFTTTEWTFRHYFAPVDPSGQSRQYRMSAYAFNPTDEWGNNHQGAGSYNQTQSAASPTTERMMAATYETRTTSLPDGTASSSYPGKAHLNFNGGAGLDTDGFYGSGGQYKIHPQRTSSPLRVGGVHDGSRFIGIITRIAFFDRDLSDAEINGIYANRGLSDGGTSTPPPVDPPPPDPTDPPTIPTPPPTTPPPSSSPESGTWVKPLGHAIKLEIATDSEEGSLVNMVPNPSGALGAWGWVTPVDGSRMSGVTGGANPPWLLYLSAAGVANYFYTEPMPIAEDEWVAGSWLNQDSTTDGVSRALFEWLDSAGEPIIPATALTDYSDADGTASTYTIGPYQAPAGVAYVRLRFHHYRNTSGANPLADTGMAIKNVTVAKSDDAADLASVRTNMVPNPSFEVSTTGWGKWQGWEQLTRVTTPVHTGSGALQLKFFTGEGNDRSGVTVGDEDLGLFMEGVVGGASYAASAYVRSTVARIVQFQVRWFSANGAHIGSSTMIDSGTTSTSAYQRFSRVFTAPVNAVKAIMAVVIKAASGWLTTTEIHYIDAAMFERATEVGSYFDGSTADAGGWDYDWSGTANNSPSTAMVGSLAYIAPIEFLNILGPSHDLQVSRKALDVGTMQVNIIDSSLDPSQSALIRPGRSIRLIAYSTLLEEWSPIFTGHVTHATVEYALTDPDEEKRARITLTAVDNVQTLSNQKRIEGVGTIAELPAVLEGCGVPWSVNGSGNQISTATVVATNDQASALDQIAITRDSVLGYAWVDRFGVLQAWDRDVIPAARAGDLLDESVYKDVNVSYNTDDLINEVNIKFLRLNPDDGSSEEVSYGPYRDASSIATWGMHAASYTIQGIDEDAVDLQAYAEAILEANSVPQVRLNSMELMVRVSDDWASVDSWFAWVDLYNMTEQRCDRASITAELSRVTEIKHTISAPDHKWVVSLGFTSDDVVASPTFTPSPTTGSTGKTISELLRPLGEVTMWYGAAADVPGGWLICDGTAIPAEYGALIALVGANTPNFTDRFPIGAGTKALGTSGGSPSVTLSTAELPRRSGASAFGSAAAVALPSATGTLTAATAVDIMNPWRSLWFIIRAR